MVTRPRTMGIQPTHMRMAPFVIGTGFFGRFKQFIQITNMFKFTLPFGMFYMTTGMEPLNFQYVLTFLYHVVYRLSRILQYHPMFLYLV